MQTGQKPAPIQQLTIKVVCVYVCSSWFSAMLTAAAAQAFFRTVCASAECSALLFVVLHWCSCLTGRALCHAR
eukprot:scaffold67788_cov22-Tisochrysis_lutea.AAC.1